jgi:hypothetical protein
MQTYQAITENQVAWEDLVNIEEYKIRAIWNIFPCHKAIPTIGLQWPL